jgi:hypothetical protein
MSNIRNCICCGKEYEYCPNCNKDNKPMWMMSFDRAECKELFNLVSAYNMGRIGIDKVRAYAKNHGLKPEAYIESIRKVIEVPKDAEVKASVAPATSDVRNRNDMPFRRKKKRKTGYRFNTARDIQ